MSASDTILGVLMARVPDGQSMTLGALRKGTGLRADQLADGLRSLRYAGKVEWDRIALLPALWADAQKAPSVQDAVAADAERAGVRRRKARSTGSVVHGAAQMAPARTAPLDGTDLQALAIENPQDAIRALQARWSDLWPRIVAQARAQGDRPIPHMVALLERGLEESVLEAAA